MDQTVAALPGDPDLARVLALPRHTDAPEELVEALSRHLSRPGSDVQLRVKQAELFRALYETGGAFGAMPTGEGKGLVTLLAPTLVDAQRPVLLLPAAERGKIQSEFAEYLSDGWNVRLPHLLSYQEMTRLDRENRLWELMPDLLELDEADVARNLDRALGRRLRRYIEGKDPRPPEERARRPWVRPRVVILSGTLITDALLDYWEMCVWALRDGAPVPSDRDGAERWACALDRTLAGELRRIDAGALASIPGGFHAWLRSTKGVVSGRGEVCPAEIVMSTWRPPLPPVLRDTIARTIASSRRPDGEPVDEWELPDVLCMLAQGFYHVWDPMPPTWWLQPRRTWYAYERAVLDAHVDGFDTAEPIRLALDNLERPQPPAANEGRQLLAAWRAVKDRFEPNPVPIWLDGSIMDAAAAHAHAHPGTIVWVKHVAPGIELARRGLPYYGADTRPDQHRTGGSIAAGMSHARGKNLQRVGHRALFLHPMATARRWEQAIAREHRPGQAAPIVYVDVMTTIDYHGEVMSRVLKQARADSEASGVPQKLTLARWTG
jgi:hypothetical protein